MPNLNDFYVLDIAVAAVVLLSAWIAYMRGLVREVVSLGTWIGAVVATLYFYPQAKQFAQQHIEAEFAADLAAGAGLFVGSFFILRLIGGTLADAIARSEQNTLDRSAGFLFGIFRGGLLAGVAYMAFSWFVPEEEHPPWLTDAKVTPMLQEGARKLHDVLPESISGDGEANAARLRSLDRQAAEIERLHKGFNQPSPKQPDADGQAPPAGYSEELRKGVQALIKSTREQNDGTGN